MSAFPENMPAPTPANGPFSHTEVSVYCDESRHEGQSSQKYMVIGGLWLLREKRYELLDRLRALQQRYRITGELKWRKLSNSRLGGYAALVDFLAGRNDVHFRCIVVDISLVYLQHGLALGTAYAPDGEWLRKVKAESTLLGP
jgi:hypothetical protein